MVVSFTFESDLKVNIMKKTIFSAFLLTTIFFVSHSFATIHRVNNSGVPADFTNWTDAFNAASAGDTIHLEPSGLSYGNLLISKPLVIIGNGYFLEQNTGLQHNTAISRIADLNPHASGNGTTLIGLTVDGAQFYTWNSGASNFTFLRCHIKRQYNTAFNNIVTNNFLFDGCYFENAGTAINLASAQSTEVMFKNCYFEASNLTFNSNCSGIFTNCVFNLTGALSVSNYQFTNNILITGTLTDNGANNFDNNLCNATQFPSGNGNQQSVDMSTVFVGYPSQGPHSDDARWVLEAGSPAEGAGVSGTDCGIFGGAGPYKPSGIPPIPTIYDLVAPGSAGNSMQVLISTRVNN